MKPKAIVILAPGFEEMEAVISIDMLRRGGIDVIIAYVGGGSLIKGSRNISIEAQVRLSDVDYLPEAVVLPGGMPGSVNLESSEDVLRMIRDCYRIIRSLPLSVPVPRTHF